MATTDKIEYTSTGTAITCTLNSLASSATAGRQSNVVDNSSNLYVDALLMATVVTGTGTLANDFTVYVYLWGSDDGTNYEGGSDENAGNGDSAMTIDSPTNLRGPIAIPTPSSNVTYKKMISVAQVFGGVMPVKWGVTVRNYSGQALAASGNSLAYTGVYYTNG